MSIIKKNISQIQTKIFSGVVVAIALLLLLSLKYSYSFPAKITLIVAFFFCLSAGILLFILSARTAVLKTPPQSSDKLYFLYMGLTTNGAMGALFLLFFLIKQIHIPLMLPPWTLSSLIIGLLGLLVTYKTTKSK